MPPSFRLALAAGLLCLAACQRSPDAPAAPPSTVAPTAAAAVPAKATRPPTPAAVPSNVTTDDAIADHIADHYACEAGTKLTRQQDGAFRAVIPGNAPVRLARIADSSPPVFTGASLYLRIEGNGEAILSQGDRTNELHCTPGQGPA